MCACACMCVCADVKNFHSITIFELSVIEIVVVDIDGQYYSASEYRGSSKQLEG